MPPTAANGPTKCTTAVNKLGDLILDLIKVQREFSHTSINISTLANKPFKMKQNRVKHHTLHTLHCWFIKKQDKSNWSKTSNGFANKGKVVVYTRQVNVTINRHVQHGRSFDSIFSVM